MNYSVTIVGFAISFLLCIWGTGLSVLPWGHHHHRLTDALASL